MAFDFKYDWFTHRIPVFERCLAQFVGKKTRGLEVGTLEGRSAAWLLENILTHPESQLTCIDIEEQPNLAGNLMATGQSHKVDVKIGYSRDVLVQLSPHLFDFAYIDGSHSTCDVLEDAVLTYRRIRVGGIIGFDDYLWNDPDYNEYGTPKPAIDTFLAANAHKLEILEHDYQVWVRKLSD
ncbi:class I SAM-dependent methyltransferase [Dyella sp. GSA-30]|uniref:class I SAM-dependent methyltransferase n=1 Tax=Dyella sp. GSA-30 TaxID=2994496 RepID=UPI002490C932|nr:class I SAM-dependent methyltransferase [Dyella sp. GSA-30]BDU20399.1 hypothetical protein DYGSA30_18560 [Dyella sp. GSA-30]